MSVTGWDQIDDTEFERVYGPWTAREPHDAASLFAGYSGVWWIAGGWAIEAFTGVSRPHHDCDPCALVDDFDLLRAHLRGRYDLWSASSGALRPVFAVLEGDTADLLLEGSGQVWLRPGGDRPWEYDLLLAPGDATTWIYKRDPAITMPMADALWERDGIRYLQPEIQLLYKAKGLRPQDQADFDACRLLLDERRREWLVAGLRRTLPDHPWLDSLT